jgi:hypothetical protein
MEKTKLKKLKLFVQVFNMLFNNYYSKHYYAENQRIASKVGSGYESKDSIDCIDRNDFFQIILDILDYQ